MHTYFHTTFGFCLWDLLALLTLIAMAALLAVHIWKQRKREKDFEDELSGKTAEKTAAPDAAGDSSESRRA